MKLTGRNTLDTTTTSETADSGLCDTLDVVTKNLAVALGTTLSETLATLATCDSMLVKVEEMLWCWCGVGRTEADATTRFRYQKRRRRRRRRHDDGRGVCNSKTYVQT